MLLFMTVYQKVLKALRQRFTVPNPPGTEILKAARELKQELKQDLEWQDKEMAYPKTARPSPKELREFVLGHGRGAIWCESRAEFDVYIESQVKFANKLLDRYGGCNTTPAALSPRLTVLERQVICRQLLAIANRIAPPHEHD
jgi:signal recognition particle subunit SEC65